MNEYVEEYEYEDDDLYDEIDALEERLDEQESLAEVQAQIAALERAHGSRFTQAEVQQIGELIDAGYTPKSVYEAVAPTSPGEVAFDNVFDQNLDHLEQQQGRALAQSEVDKLYEQASRLNDPRHVADGAVRDLTNRKDRIAHVNERIAEPVDVPETVEPLAEDAGPKERAAFIDARVAGAEVGTDTYEGETE